MLFESKGYAAVTMEQVAGEAGVSKRTLYKYFAAKEALLEQVLEAELAKDLAARNFALDAQAGFRAAATALLHESARWCEQHADVLLPYIRYEFASFDPAASAERDRGLLPVWTLLIRAAQERGEIAAAHRPEQLGTYFHYLYLGALMRWLTQPRLGLTEELDTVVGLFLDGAAARQDRRTTSSAPIPSPTSTTHRSEFEADQRTAPSALLLAAPLALPVTILMGIADPDRDVVVASDTPPPITKVMASRTIIKLDQRSIELGDRTHSSLMDTREIAHVTGLPVCIFCHKQTRDSLGVPHRRVQTLIRFDRDDVMTWARRWLQEAKDQGIVAKANPAG
ncbi:MAG TPA: TetR/AcrR family transcriptional regulator [Burkholderiaceae bacterium]|nr:TetR/AcrR family transcriptional regulator [Burkholderiaceae bacterium]